MRFKLTDNLSLGKVQIYKDAMNCISDMKDSNRSYSLNVRMRATNSGYLLNRRVYPGVAMKKSVGTWTDAKHGGTAPYNKPILINHDSYDVKSAIGRVTRAEYVQLKQGDAFVKDFKNPSTGTDLGSGYIILDGKVTDPDAVMRILDGRFNTVSTSFHTDDGFCSICGHNIIESLRNNKDLCEHTPGRTYKFEDKEYPCYLVSGLMDYEEVSYVSLPAQPNAFNLQVALDQSSGETANAVTQDNASVLSMSLSDSEGHNMELIVKDGEENKLPDIAKKFLKTAVAIPGDIKGDSSMELKGDAIISTWVEDLSKQEDKKEVITPDTQDKKEEAKVEDKKETPAVPPVKDTQEELTSLKDKVTTLNATVDTVTRENVTLSDEVKKLRASIESKSELVKELTDENTKLKQSAIKDAARQLAVMRINLQKPGTIGVDNKEKFDKLVDELSKRGIDSLRDSIADLLPEVDQMIKNKSSVRMVMDREVSDPTLKQTDSKKTPETKSLVSKDAFLDDEN